MTTTITIPNTRIKQWSYNSSVMTAGFIVDRCVVEYTELDPGTLESLGVTFAGSTGDVVDVYVTVNGNETLLFSGLVRQWELTSEPGGILLARLTTEDLRTRLLDTYVPQGLFSRGNFVDPVTGVKSGGLTFHQAIQLLGALADVSIDPTPVPDYDIGPHVSFSGRTTVGTAIARLLKVYQYVLLFHVDLIRTGINTFALRQRPQDLSTAEAQGLTVIHVPDSAIRLRHFTRSFVPRVDRAIMNGALGGKAGKCSRDFRTGEVKKCNLPFDVIELYTVTREPFVNYDAKERIVDEGYIEYTKEYPGKILKIVKVHTVTIYDDNITADHPEPTVGVTNSTETTTNQYDGDYIKPKVYREIQETVQYPFSVENNPQFVDPTLVSRTTTTHSYNDAGESIMDATVVEKLVGVVPGTKPAKPLSPAQFLHISTDIKRKVATPSGFTLKTAERWIMAYDSGGVATPVLDQSTSEQSPGDMRPGSLALNAGYTFTPSSTQGAAVTNTGSGLELTIQDEMINDQTIENSIAGWALEMGNSFHVEIEVEMPIDINILPHTVIHLDDPGIAGITRFFVIDVTMHEAPDDAKMVVKGEVWQAAPAANWGGLLATRQGLAYYGVVSTGFGGTTFLHGQIMSGPDSFGHYEVFCQEEATTYPSVECKGAAQQAVLTTGDNVVLERNNMTLYIIA